MKNVGKEQKIRFDYLYEGKVRGIRYGDFRDRLKKDRYLSEHLSNKAVLVYCVLYNMSINICSANGWVDKEKRMYILPPIYGMRKYFQITTEEIDTAIKELDEKTGIGLIKCVPADEGTNYKIYVKNFSVRKINRREILQVPQSADIDEEILEAFIQALKNQVEYDWLIMHSRLGDIILIGKIFNCLLELLLLYAPEIEMEEKRYSPQQVKKALCFVDRSYFERLLRELHRENVEACCLKIYICQWLIRTAVIEAAPVLDIA